MAILLQDENLFTEVGHMKYLLHVGNLIGGRSVIPVLYFVRLLRDVAHNNYAWAIINDGFDKLYRLWFVLWSSWKQMEWKLMRGGLSLQRALMDSQNHLYV